MKFWKWRRLTLFLVIFITSVIIIGFAVWANQSRSVVPVSNTAVEGATAVNSKPFITDYFTVTLPETMVVKNVEKPKDSPILENMLISARPSADLVPYSDKIAITIGNAPSGGPAAISDVHLRKLRPEIYTPLAISYAPPGYLAYSSHQDSLIETDIFWTHGGKYTAVAFSSAENRSPEQNDLLRQLFSSWQWK